MVVEMVVVDMMKVGMVDEMVGAVMGMAMEMPRDMTVYIPHVPWLRRSNAFGAFSFTGPKRKINRGATDTMEMEIEIAMAM